MDLDNTWLLSAYTWSKDKFGGVHTTIIADGIQVNLPLSHLVMGVPEPGQNWWRKDRKNRSSSDYRRENLYLAGFYYIGKKKRPAHEQARRNRAILAAVHAAVVATTGDRSGRDTGRVRLHTPVCREHVPDMGTDPLWTKQVDVQQRQGDGT